MIDHFMLARFQHSKFVLKVYSLQKQSVIDHLRLKISEGLCGWTCFLVVTDNELILRRNPQFELLAATHNIKHVVLQDGEESDHPQRGRLPRQDIDTDLLIFSDLDPLCAYYGRENA